MKALKYLAIVLAGFFIFTACSKEFSVENGLGLDVASGSLLDTSGNCQDIAVTGAYIVDSTLGDSNYVDVQVNFLTAGTYSISTDLQNGFSFSDSGYMTATGLQTVRLKANGKPILAKETIFQVTFDSTFCTFAVTVEDAPANGGQGTAVFTTGDCANTVIAGTYTQGVALDASNTVTMEANVSHIGTYNIVIGPVNGITFTASDSFAATGLQPLVLHATGTPASPGPVTVTLTANGSTCSFTINVADGGGGSDPNSSDTAWHFTEGANSYSGSFDDVYDSTISGAYGLIFIGSTAATSDTAIQFGVVFSSTSIQPGTYTTNTLSAFRFEDHIDPANPAVIYNADYTTPTAVTTITIATYDATTKIITGTFTGTAMNASGIPVTITNGRFTASVR